MVGEFQSLQEGLGTGLPNKLGSFEKSDLEGTQHCFCSLPRSLSISGYVQHWSLQGNKVYNKFAQVSGCLINPNVSCFLVPMLILLIPTLTSMKLLLAAQQCITSGHAVSEVYNINTCAYEFIVYILKAMLGEFVGSYFNWSKKLDLGLY